MDDSILLRSQESLAKSPLFVNTEPEILREILSHFSYVKFKKDTIIYDYNSPCDKFYLILTGRVKLQQISPQGKTQTLFLLSGGDVFDFICLLDGGNHSTEAITVDDCELLACPTQEIKNLLETHPQINKTFLPYLGRQMRDLTNLASELSLSNTSTRLAHLIIKHLRGGPNDGQPHLIFDLSHEEIANMIGTVRVVVNRHIQKMKQEGILQARRKQLFVKNMKALLSKAEEKYGISDPK